MAIKDRLRKIADKVIGRSAEDRGYSRETAQIFSKLKGHSYNPANESRRDNLDWNQMYKQVKETRKNKIYSVK
jgi:hypothetical protein